MQALYAADRVDLSEKTRTFEEHMEPLLRKLDRAASSVNPDSRLPEVGQYLQVCRWAFRRLEYSFALDALLRHLMPGDRYLDAGCGVTPLPQVLAGRGVETYACDGNRRVIEGFTHLGPEAIYGARVTYAVEDLRWLSYDDATFDAVSCISVLEHIPAPDDQQAVRELLRVLKPGGLLVLTVDFMPGSTRPLGRWLHYGSRIAQLVGDGQFSEIPQGLARKLRAGQAVQKGLARQPRSANQSFDYQHIELDILPLLEGDEVASKIGPFPALRSVQPGHARHLWQLDADPLTRNARPVLPAGCIVRKPHAVACR